MPELPDVEGFRAVLKRAVGPRVDDVDVLDDGVLRGTTSSALVHAITGRTFGAPRRHGKWLIAPVRQLKRQHRADEPSVVFHFGMTGALVWSTDNDEHKHDRIVVTTTRGRLRYRDMRKLQGVRLVDDDAAVGDLVDTGIDATEISVAQLRDRLRRSRRQLKPALLDQSIIAGLGNLLADEVLWRARLHPRSSTHDLDSTGYERLRRSIRDTLDQAIPAGRVPDHQSWLTGRRDDPDGECPRCNSTLRRDQVGGRRTAWCPQCQQT